MFGLVLSSILKSNPIMEVKDQWEEVDLNAIKTREARMRERFQARYPPIRFLISNEPLMIPCPHCRRTDTMPLWRDFCNLPGFCYHCFAVVLLRSSFSVIQPNPFHIFYDNSSIKEKRRKGHHLVPNHSSALHTINLRAMYSQNIIRTVSPISSEEREKILHEVRAIVNK